MIWAFLGILIIIVGALCSAVYVGVRRGQRRAEIRAVAEPAGKEIIAFYRLQGLDTEHANLLLQNVIDDEYRRRGIYSGSDDTRWLAHVLRSNRGSDFQSLWRDLEDAVAKALEEHQL